MALVSHFVRSISIHSHSYREVSHTTFAAWHCSVILAHCTKVCILLPFQELSPPMNSHSFHCFAISIPSANVPTLASIAYPSLSNLLHFSHKPSNGVVNTSINSFSSNSGLRFLFSGKSMSTSTCTILRFVLQNPGSMPMESHQYCGCHGVSRGHVLSSHPLFLMIVQYCSHPTSSLLKSYLCHETHH